MPCCYPTPCHRLATKTTVIISLSLLTVLGADQTLSYMVLTRSVSCSCGHVVVEGDVILKVPSFTYTSGGWWWLSAGTSPRVLDTLSLLVGWVSRANVGIAPGSSHVPVYDLFQTSLSIDSAVAQNKGDGILHPTSCVTVMSVSVRLYGIVCQNVWNGRYCGSHLWEV